ncbi:glycosyltransferase family protein [Pseudomonas sp. GM60]|uniref:glycosyltransferase family protein n=1 Tax=Pseudomonas sp. GM60 TaxID=1144334 RepID=UPI0002709631|nr:glycosyltransferase [Pseudomonas sp. GM60]EJM82757.1 glycosyltransferase [Pseudomonas sp. GM60]
MVRFFKNFILISWEVFLLPFVFLAALLARFVPKSVEIGLGPEPLINNVYHAKALKSKGWQAETFVDSLYFITNEFDVKLVSANKLVSRAIRLSFLPYFFSIFRYRVIYIYFNGGGLYAARLLWVLEPFLYRLAGVKVVVMPYGGDVQDMQKSGELYFKHVVDKDYPRHFRRRMIIRCKVWMWSLYADHVISGCDWVDYMQHWDTLCISHFSIDLDSWASSSDEPKSGPVRILHAPNHKNIKGTRFFELAVERLKRMGYEVELIMVQGVPNAELKKMISDCDIVADQLVIGWYAMFAIEAMALGKPVLCYVRDDLEELYVRAGLLERGELPLIKCSPKDLDQVLEKLVVDRLELQAIGERGRAYVEKRHSLDAIGTMFNAINESLEVRSNV